MTTLEKLADKTWPKITRHLDNGAADEAYTELLFALRIANQLPAKPMQ